MRRDECYGSGWVCWVPARDPDGVGMETAIQRMVEKDGTVTVRVSGEIEFSNAADVARALRDAVADWSPPALRVDLRDATFIDSTGLGTLIEGYRAAAEQACRFTVVNPASSFR